ncbi:MAG TPA: glycosyltransferase family 2 protein [Tepidisphaeraceae bacterium]
MKISIVTPSFNQARFLEQTLRSVISQRDQVHEYFVFDGGSTDDSADVIRRYADGIDHWVSESDAGQGDAIRRGFARATGDWLGWINSDDVYLPGALEHIARAIEVHPEWDVLTAWHVRMDENSRIVSAHRMPGESARWARWGVTHVNQQTCFFKRSLYEKVGGIRPDLHCVLDTELWFRFFDAGARWGHVPAYLAGFRVHGGQKWSTLRERYAEEFGTLDRAYPRYHGGGPRHYAGRAMHKAMQMLSGREIAARRDARRWSGCTVEEVFGRWDRTDIRHEAGDGARA